MQEHYTADECRELAAENWEYVDFALSQPFLTALMWMSYDHPSQRNALIEEYEQHVPTRKHIRLSMLGLLHSEMSLWNYWQQNLPAECYADGAEQYVVHLIDSESLILAYQGEQPSIFIADINLHRELIFRDRRYVLVFWTTQYCADVVHRLASDFWDWVQHAYRFPLPDAERIALLQPAEQPSEPYISPKEREKHEANIAQYSKQLEALPAATNSRTAEARVTLLFLLADAYQAILNYSTALHHATTALALIQQYSANNFWALDRAYDKQGNAYHALGQLTQALTAYQQCVAILEEKVPADHPEMARAYNNIGIAYKAMGNIAKGLAYQEKALEICQQLLPATHPYLAASYNNVGTAYQAMGNMAKGLAYQEKALEIWQQLLPATHPNLATSYNNVGSAYKAMGDIAKGLAYQEKALAIRQQILPATHPNLATSYNNIGLAYQATGDVTKGLSYQEKALEIYQQILPATHPDLAASYNNVVGCYIELERYAEALDYAHKALAIYQQHFDNSHPQVAELLEAIPILEELSSAGF